MRRLTLLAQRYKQAYITQGALLRLSELASTISDMRDFYPAIHQMVSELLHAENFYVVFYDSQTGQYSPQYFSDEKDQQLIAQVPSSAFSSGLTGYVARSGQPLPAQDLIQWSRQHMANYKVPRHIVFRPDLPKTNVGKILRRELRDA